MKNDEKNGARRTLSLRTRLILSYLLISLTAVTIVGALSVNNIYKFSARETERTSVSNLTAAGNSLLDGIGSLREEAIRPIIEKASLRAISALFSGETPEYADSVQLQMHLSSTKGVNSIYSLILVNDRNVIISDRQPGTFSWAQLSAFPWFAAWYAGSSDYHWGSPYKLDGFNVVPYVHKIWDGGRLIGVSVLNVYEWTFFDACHPYGDVVVLDADGVVVSAGEKSALGRDFFTAYGIAPAAMDGSGGIRFRSGSVQKMAVYYAVPNEPFRMVEFVTFGAARAAMENMLVSTLGVVAVCFLLCVALSLWASSRITKPIKKIRATIDSLELESLSSGMRAHSSDEIGLLIDSVNNMTLRLNASKDEILRISEERRAAEFRAIQLQINPHFLYNTLSSICWLIDEQQSERAKSVTNSLSTLFRLSVNHGRETLRIQEELNHVRCYLDIQKVRHEGEFTYQIDVDPDILDYYIIKILLQPLAENALEHGIRENGVKDGLIRIRGFRSGQDIVLEVIDNGSTPQAGIDRMNAVLAHPDENAGAGIGMLNVHNRIRYYYQHEYGLVYEKQGALTIARIRIPVREE